MAIKTRIYLVRGDKSPRLVRASHPNAAIQHVVERIYSAAVASQDDLERFLGEGVRVETAGAEQLQLQES
jgi:hypothetical protein